MLISSGIEKFYTYAQFFTVLFISLSLLAAAVLGVFILTRPAEKGKKTVFTMLFLSFLLYLVSELALSVTPTHQAMTVRLYLNTAALGLLCRVFFFFSLKLGKGTMFPSSAGFIVITEGALFTICIAAFHPFLPLFTSATLDLVQPSRFYSVFLSISLCCTHGRRLHPALYTAGKQSVSYFTGMCSRFHPSVRQGIIFPEHDGSPPPSPGRTP